MYRGIPAKKYWKKKSERGVPGETLQAYISTARITACGMFEHACGMFEEEKQNQPFEQSLNDFKEEFLRHFFFEYWKDQLRNL